jgi:hypothetical protein
LHLVGDLFVPLLTLNLVKPRYTAEAILKNCELLIYGGILHFTTSCAKNSNTLTYAVNLIFRTIVSYCHQQSIFSLHMTYGKI